MPTEIKRFLVYVFFLFFLKEGTMDVFLRRTCGDMIAPASKEEGRRMILKKPRSHQFWRTNVLRIEFFFAWRGISCIDVTDQINFS